MADTSEFSGMTRDITDPRPCSWGPCTQPGEIDLCLEGKPVFMLCKPHAAMLLLIRETVAYHKEYSAK